METKLCRTCSKEFEDLPNVVNCPDCRQKNADKKHRSRQRQAMAHGVDADSWVDNFDTEYPEIAQKRREHSKQFRETVQAELNTALPSDVQLDVLDAVADIYVALQHQKQPGWIQKTTDPTGFIYSGILYPDVVGSAVRRACAAHHLAHSESFRKKYVDVLAHLDQKFGNNVNNPDAVLADNATSVKSELDRLAT